MNEQDSRNDNNAAPALAPPIPPPLPSFEDRDARLREESLGLPLRGRDTVALVLLTLLADLCLYRSWGGAGGAALLVAAMVALLTLRGREGSARSAGLCVVVLALAAVLAWSAWWLAALLAVVACCLFAVGLWRPEWSLTASLLMVPQTVLVAPMRLFGHIAARRQAPWVRGRSSVPAKVVVIPVVISVAFLCIFAAANPVVGREFTRVWDHVLKFLERWTDYLCMERFLFWCGGLLVFAALIRPVVRSAAADVFEALGIRLASCEDAMEDDGDSLVALVTLVCVNVLFLGYNAMDAVYLYFKATLPAGITWTAYTHAGCGWLTFGLFLSTVVLGFIFWDRLNFHARTPLLKRLAYLWIALNAVLAVGTLRRIHMYIDFSGLTHLLLTGVYGSLLVMAGLAIMTAKVRGNYSAIWLLRQYVAAFAIGLLVLALTPHGWVCARYNVPRILAGKPHALWPVVLKELPADALPAIVPLLDYRREDGNVAKERLVREGIAGILGQHLARLEREEARPWGQWQGASKWALGHLRPVREKIAGTVPAGQWNEAKMRLKRDYDLSGEP